MNVTTQLPITREFLPLPSIGREMPNVIGITLIERVTFYHGYDYLNLEPEMGETFGKDVVKGRRKGKFISFLFTFKILWNTLICIPSREKGFRRILLVVHVTSELSIFSVHFSAVNCDVNTVPN